MAAEQEIFILPDYIANQIAAGEVVQRPESVVKELVENSLDSGADTITVLVRDAGKTLIHVIDNGRGMSGEDLLLSVRRHATSKIRTQADLEKIATLGFRGEALASISAVANLELRTKRKADESGYRLVSEPNKEPVTEHFHTENGTQVLVRNLFYNVPARKKFLRSNLTEFRHISETMMRFALAHPAARFVFYQDNDLIFDVRPGDTLERIRALFDKTYPDYLLELRNAENGVDIGGYLGKPDIAKRMRGSQFIFLNGRHIQSRYLNHAITSVLEHIMPEGYFPFYLLRLDMDTGRYDVNIHPQKHEAKFEDETLIYNMVKSAIQNALRAGNMTPVIELGKDIAANPFVYEGGSLVRRDTGEVIDQQRHAFPSSRAWQPPAAGEAGAATGRLLAPLPDPGGIERKEPDAAGTPSQASYWQPDMHHIVAADSAGLKIYSLERLLEAVAYLRLKGRKSESGMKQELFFPIHVNADKTGIYAATQMKGELSRIGFEFTAQEDGLLLSAVPADAGVGSEAGIFSDLIEGAAVTDRKIFDIRYSRAFSARNLRILSQFEIKGLFEELRKEGFDGYTATGKPVCVGLSYGEISSKLG